MTAPRNKSKKGFSLIELCFAMAILAVGFICVLGMFPTSFTGITGSKNMILATHLAQSQLEKIKFVDYDSIANQAQTPVNYSNTVNGVPVSTLFYKQVNVTSNPGNTLKDVVVQVFWQEGAFNGNDMSRWKCLQFETYISRQQ
ncbi:MAG: prepilin-type N-terminal cleavage/methylation domain-containing protein [Firmicutes bacterium]|nr:prepilin-type N-terminal cleavage/methylation domain-containing protein [Bacillota bacterium]